MATGEAVAGANLALWLKSGSVLSVTSRSQVMSHHSLILAVVRSTALVQIRLPQSRQFLHILLPNSHDTRFCRQILIFGGPDPVLVSNLPLVEPGENLLLQFRREGIVSFTSSGRCSTKRKKCVLERRRGLR